MAGTAKGSAVSVTVTLGTGVGAGIVIHDKIYHGFNQINPELGHTVIMAGGEPCSCGRKGCWEVYATAVSLAGQAWATAQRNPHSLSA